VSSYSDHEAVRSEAHADLREAYERGRRDGRAGHRRHPIAMTFIMVAAAIGLIVLALAAVNGSFSGAGTVVDRNLTTASEKAGPVVKNAADQAGQAVKDVTSRNGTSATDQQQPR